ncbi:MAG: MerR family transcriptional regulator [Gemmatimonadaceae bacterium]
MATIPVREFFSIGDVCDLTDLKPHVLRYWESQFRFLHPAKNRSGNRVYQRREVELIMLVKDLLYVDKYTIDGARARVDEFRRNGELKHAARSALEGGTVASLEKELNRIIAALDGVDVEEPVAESDPGDSVASEDEAASALLDDARDRAADSAVDDGVAE